MTGFIKLAVKNLERHRTRSLLTMLGIGASVAVLFSILSFNRGFEQGLSRELQRTGIHFMVVPSGCAHEVASLVLHGAVIPKFLDTGVIGHLRNVEGIDLIAPLLVAQVANPGRGGVDLVYGMEMTALTALKPGWQIRGAVPASGDQILLGSEIAGHYQVREGDRFDYPDAGVTLTVAGVVEPTGSQDDAFVYMELATAQKLLGNPGGATAIGVRVGEPEEMQTIIDRLSEKVPGIQIVTMGQVMNSISNLAASAKSLSLSVALIAVLISAVGVMNSILMAVFERTQEIGMMRAIGASRRDVFQIILKETVILALGGGLAGLIAAALGARLIEAFVRAVMPYVPDGRMVTFAPDLALVSVGFTFAVGIAAGIYPAWKAAKINPMEAIRG
ncbi:MAG: FtsX-like permease family protein [Thermodesulfobacteriota bacterium]